MGALLDSGWTIVDGRNYYFWWHCVCVDRLSEIEGLAG